MSVAMHAVVSVDDFIADSNDDVGPLFEWYFNGEAEIVDGGPFRVTETSLGYVRPMWERIGGTVMGSRCAGRSIAASQRSVGARRALPDAPASDHRGARPRNPTEGVTSQPVRR